MKFIKLYELKIFTAEDVLCEDEPFYKALFKEARRLGLGGGTMIRADAGYGQQIRGNDGRLCATGYTVQMFCDLTTREACLFPPAPAAAMRERWRNGEFDA